MVYWMQASQRVRFNHALEYAIREANTLKKPVVACFGITDRFPEANARHYAFMLEGLREVQEALTKRGIHLVVRCKSPDLVAVTLAKQACLVVTDRGYLRIQRAWRRHVAKKAPCFVVEVESDAVVPVEAASEKEAYSAATLRPRINKILRQYMAPLKETLARRDSLDCKLDGIDLTDLDNLMDQLNIDRSVLPVGHFQGGPSAADRLFEDFLSLKLKHYADRRNDPSLDYASHMSPYLHFGQISPLDLALRVREAPNQPKKAKDAYMEELVVRRELSINFVYHNKHYDSFKALPEWAQRTLHEHRVDRREYLYGLDVLERAETHDPYWNAAQREMALTGKMHNYMRMYWGKKILEWSETPEAGFKNTLYLNNKYELDGRDPNSFAGVAWCFGKHDRAWKERAIFGKVRYMNARGLERKFDIGAYVRNVRSLEKNLSRPA